MLRGKQRLAYESLKVEVLAMCDLDFAANYDSADSMAEGVLSEIEAGRDVSEEDADDINGIVTDWYYAHEDETEGEEEEDNAI